MLSEINLNLLKECAEHYNIDLNGNQLHSFSKYMDLLLEWNEKINLTSITEEKEIVIKHFVDSLSILPNIPEKPVKLIDVGTGAGFPGISVKLVRENIKVTLLDSLEKRVKFLSEVCSNLQLNDIKAFHGRAEDFGSDKRYREHFDIAVARAVAAMPVLLEYCLPFVKIGGIFMAMKGPDVKSELIDSQKAIEILGGELMDVKSFNLPKSDYERCIVLIRKCRHTPLSYPRKSGKPTKSPIK